MIMDFQIRFFPDPVLRKKAARVHEFNAALEEIIRKLDAAMRAQTSGIGIAAPQIGNSLRIAIVDISRRLPGAEKLILVNPEIVKAWEKRLSREGCMSLPEYTAQLPRFDRVHLRWQDSAGRFREGVFGGLQAVCIQHEIDHLEGLLIIDRVVSLKRDLIPRPIRRLRPS